MCSVTFILMKLKLSSSDTVLHNYRYSYKTDVWIDRLTDWLINWLSDYLINQLIP